MFGIYYRKSRIPSDMYTDGRNFFRNGVKISSSEFDPTRMMIGADIARMPYPLLNVHVLSGRKLGYARVDVETPRTYGYAREDLDSCFDLAASLYESATPTRFVWKNVVYFRCLEHSVVVISVRPFRKHVFESGQWSVSDTETEVVHRTNGACVFALESVVDVVGRHLDYAGYASSLRLNANIKSRSVVRSCDRRQSSLVNLRSYRDAVERAVSPEAKEYFSNLLDRYVERIKYKDPVVLSIANSLRIRDAKAAPKR